TTPAVASFMALASLLIFIFFFFQAEDGIRDYKVTGVQTCALLLVERDLLLHRDVPEHAEDLDEEPREEAREHHEGQWEWDRKRDQRQHEHEHREGRDEEDALRSPAQHQEAAENEADGRRGEDEAPAGGAAK